MKQPYKRIMINYKANTLHRHIMEQYIGRPLRSDEQVHHINHDKYDNRIENLKIMTASEHHSLHALTTIRTPTHKTCSQCRKLLPHNKFAHDKKNIDRRRSNCLDCQNDYNKKRLAKLKAERLKIFI